MLSPTAFAEQRQAISRSGPPSTGDNLLGMEIDFLAELGDPAYADNPHPLWTEPIVDRQPDWLIHLSATARPGATPAQIEQALTTAWTQTLRYTYREAHTVSPRQPQSPSKQSPRSIPATCGLLPKPKWCCQHLHRPDLREHEVRNRWIAAQYYVTRGRR